MADSWLRWCRMLAALGNSRPSGLGLQDLLQTVIVATRWRNDLRQFLAFDNHLELIGIENFPFQQGHCDSDQGIVVRRQNALGGLVPLVDHALYFFVDLDRRGLAVIAMLIDLAAQEDLLFF